MREIFPSGPAVIGPAPPGDDGPRARRAVAALAALYAYPEAGPGAAPWLRANMISSADGAASLDGRSGGLSGPGDRLVFSVLRSLADVILVGAGTARAEKYRPVRTSEIWPRLREGRPGTPPIAVITRSADLDPDSPLLAGAHGPARTIVLTTQAAPAGQRGALARHADVVVTGQDTVTPLAAVRALADRGHRRVLVEGGPSLLAQISGAGLLDEICLTFSPVLAAGRAGRILSQPDGTAPGPGLPEGLRLAHVLEDQGFLLCRYRRDAG